MKVSGSCYSIFKPEDSNSCLPEAQGGEFVPQPALRSSHRGVLEAVASAFTGFSCQVLKRSSEFLGQDAST